MTQAFTFKSTGRMRSAVDIENAALVVSTPLGIKTPLEASDEPGELFKQHRTLRGFIRDNLRNLLLTNWGTRLLRYDYGANLLPLAFEYTSMTQESFEGEISQRISTAVGRWMPYIVLQSFGVSPGSATQGLGSTPIKVLVTYDVPTANIRGDAVELSFNCL